MPSDPCPFTQLYFSSEYLAPPRIMGSLSLFIYSWSVSLTGLLHIHCSIPAAEHTHSTEWVPRLHLRDGQVVRITPVSPLSICTG